MDDNLTPQMWLLIEESLLYSEDRIRNSQDTPYELRREKLDLIASTLQRVRDVNRRR
jgi:hypothetical protein